MKVNYCSDLHLEFESNSRFLRDLPMDWEGDILIMAGDIIPLQEGFRQHPFFAEVSRRFGKVFWLAGNHEFYHENVDRYGFSYSLPVMSNLFLVNNYEIELGGVRFIFSTLWSYIRPENERRIAQGVSDFSCIRIQNTNFTPAACNQLHSDSLTYLDKVFENREPLTVVVTHHLPSAVCNSPVHDLSPLNEAFCTDLSPRIRDYEARFWIHGHSHYNYPVRLLGKTFLLTNQLGYIDYQEQLGFRYNAWFLV